MPAQSVYLSCAAADWETTRSLRDALQAASISVISRQPNAIRSAWRFVACFSRDPGVAVRYDRRELLEAIDRPRLAPGQRWLLALKLSPCHLPVLPIDWRHVPTLGPTTDWNEVVDEIFRRELRGKETSGQSTNILRTKEILGENLILTNARLAEGMSEIPDVYSEVEADVISMNGDVNISNLVVGHDRNKKK